MLKLKKILLDPGHGAKDPGAVNKDLIEKDIALYLTLEVAVRLMDFVKVQIYQHPYVNWLDDLKTVVDYANKNNFDYFISIHINAGKGSGFESFIHPNTSNKNQQYVSSIHKCIMEYLKKFNIDDRGVKKKDLYVLRETKMHSALLECLFIDNEKDSALLKDINFLSGLANEIAYGVRKTFELQRNENTNNCGRIIYLKANNDDTIEG